MSKQREQENLARNLSGMVQVKVDGVETTAAVDPQDGRWYEGWSGRDVTHGELVEEDDMRQLQLVLNKDARKYGPHRVVITRVWLSTKTLKDTVRFQAYQWFGTDWEYVTFSVHELGAAEEIEFHCKGIAYGTVERITTTEA